MTKNQSGFTLLEIIVVVAIMGILAAIAIPSLNLWRSQEKQVASDILGGLRQARSLAISTNQAVTATVDPDGHQLTINGITRELSANVGLETSTNDAAWSGVTDGVTIFYPNGSCSAVLYIKVNADDNLKVSIDSTASGLARL